MLSVLLDGDETIVELVDVPTEQVCIDDLDLDLSVASWSDSD